MPKTMPKNVMISGATPTGKTMVVIALAAKLRARGKSVAYFKPVGERSYDAEIDDDATLMKDLLKMKAEPGCICPVILTPASHTEMLRTGREELIKKIESCYSEVSGASDYILIESTAEPWDMLHVDLSAPQIAKVLNAKVVCLVTFTDETSLDDVLLHRDFFRQYGIDSISVILFQVPPMLRTFIDQIAAPKLKELGIGFCGAVYQNRELFGPTIRDIVRALEGQMVIGEDKMHVSIDQFMVGSMESENALKWFRRVAGKAVISSGDRTDVCLAALETDTKLLILTGGMGPDIRTVARAKTLGIPIMLTAKDTYATSQIVDHLVGTITSDNKEKIASVERIIGESIDISCL